MEGTTEDGVHTSTVGSPGLRLLASSGADVRLSSGVALEATSLQRRSARRQNGKNQGITNVDAIASSRLSGAPTRKKSLNRYPPGP